MLTGCPFSPDIVTDTSAGRAYVPLSCHKLNLMKKKKEGKHMWKSNLKQRARSETKEEKEYLVLPLCHRHCSSRGRQ